MSTNVLTRLTAVVILLISSVCYSGEVLIYPNKSIEFLGEITPGDAKVVDSAIAGLTKITLTVNSAGGDVFEAMKIGRLARKYNLMVYVGKDGKCFSSCVLILAGGTKRVVFGSVGIHRPFFAAVDDNTDIAATYRRMIVEMQAYLIEMTVPESLTDQMMSIPPEDMQILDKDQVAFYFPKEDPIADEIRASNDAKERGISTGELRRREAAARTICSEHREALDAAKMLDDPSLKMLAGMNWAFCLDAASWDLTLEEYLERIKLGKAACNDDRMAEDVQSDCRRSIMIAK